MTNHKSQCSFFRKKKKIKTKSVLHPNFPKYLPDKNQTINLFWPKYGVIMTLKSKIKTEVIVMHGKLAHFVNRSKTTCITQKA